MTRYSLQEYTTGVHNITGRTDIDNAQIEQNYIPRVAGLLSDGGSVGGVSIPALRIEQMRRIITFYTGLLPAFIKTGFYCKLECRDYEYFWDDMNALLVDNDFSEITDNYFRGSLYRNDLSGLGYRIGEHKLLPIDSLERYLALGWGLRPEFDTESEIYIRFINGIAVFSLRVAHFTPNRLIRYKAGDFIESDSVYSRGNRLEYLDNTSYESRRRKNYGRNYNVTDDINGFGGYGYNYGLGSSNRRDEDYGRIVYYTWEASRSDSSQSSLRLFPEYPIAREDGVFLEHAFFYRFGANVLLDHTADVIASDWIAENKPEIYLSLLCSIIAFDNKDFETSKTQAETASGSMHSLNQQQNRGRFHNGGFSAPRRRLGM